MGARRAGSVDDRRNNGMSADDIKIVRDLAHKYMEMASRPVQAERRKLWSAHYGRKKTRPPVTLRFGMWNKWCRDYFADGRMQCKDPFLRGIERTFKNWFFLDEAGDDSILEPWYPFAAAVKGEWEQLWGVKEGHQAAPVDGGAWKFDPPIKEWSEVSKLRPTEHFVDESATKRNLDRLQSVIGDIMPIDVQRTPCYIGFNADISTDLAKLRGLEQMMMDMYEYPDELHKLLAFMRDGILANNKAGEEAGHFSLTSATNQAMPYVDDLEWRKPNSGPRKRSQLWGFCAAQEFTLVSPEFHEEFMLKYQLPIMQHYGLVHYGCCENLTRKIDMLRQIKNLRSIAVTPTADLGQCVEQIGRDYIVSWRPNPTDMVCTGWDESRIRRILSEGFAICKDSYMHINLKDIETLQEEPDRLQRWIRIVREELDKAGW
ncbi:MAG: hypothetical protein C0404_10835 [Verrucomicrobia bacterium]|nr:hypothetical protein [Verrucomicrobiota bacterium]